MDKVILPIKKAVYKVKEKVSAKRESGGVSSDSKFKFYAKRVLLIIVLLLALIEGVFAIMIYGFKTEDKVTRFVARYIPFPAVFSSAGVVTMSEYWYNYDYIVHFYQSTGQQSVNSSDLKKQILQQLVENNIINSEAKKFKITVSNEEVDKTFNEIAKNNGSEEEVKKVLNELYGLNVDQFKELIKSQLLRDKINKEEIQRVSASHILIRLDEGADQAKIDEAKKKIEGIQNEIKGGLSFADAAKKYSEDVGSNEKGGQLEAFSRGDMVKEFEEVAFSTPVGEISAPFRTSFGWHILKVDGKTGQIEKSFNDWISGLYQNVIKINIY